MNGLLQFAASNTLVAALAAVVVVALTRVWRNPHLGHLLWALVLLKLVTPPLLSVPIGFLGSPLPRQVAADAAGETVAATAEQIVPDDSVATSTKVAGKAPINGPASSVALSAESRRNFDWATAVVFVWLAGSGLRLGVLVVRVLRFDRRVRTMHEASAQWQEEVAALAGRLGLRRWPGVRLAEGAISPLLWSVGARPVIVLPQALVEQLDAGGRRALLAHEIAHYDRRDHWLRWFEMLVLAIHWWNPIAWLACRQLRAAEERCCDACAVWLLDGEARVYGRALLAVIDFLTACRATAPMAASGMASSGNLKGRFEMILQTPFGRRLSWRTRLALSAAALAVLPLSLDGVPNHAAAEPAKENAPMVVDSDAADGLRVELPRGGRMELMAVSVLPQTDSSWWAPSGGPTEFVSKERGSLGFESPERKSREFVAHAPEDVSILPYQSKTTMGGPGELHFVVDFAPDATTGTVFVGTADDPWKTIHQVDGPDGAVSGWMRTEDGELHPLMVTPATERNGHAVLTFVHDLRMRRWALRVVAVTRAGARVTGGGGTVGGIPSAVLSAIEFPEIKLADVERFEIQVRPYHWWAFEDVALDPNVKAHPRALSYEDLPKGVDP